MSQSFVSRRRIGLMGAAAAAILALASVPAGAVASMQKAVQVSAAGRRFEFRRENLWGGGSGWDNGRRFRRGWSNRHQQRLALKKRNQARHGRACRG